MLFGEQAGLLDHVAIRLQLPDCFGVDVTGPSTVSKPRVVVANSLRVLWKWSGDRMTMRL